MIGIVGGIGPLAGIDLSKKIIENTIAKKDQGHIPIILVSSPKITDRTDFILGIEKKNPGIEIAKIISILESVGATNIGIACNTAHTPKIFDKIISLIRKKHSHICIVNMIEEVMNVIKKQPNYFQNVGILCTSGTYKTSLYQNAITAIGLNPLVLDREKHDRLVHESIYNCKYGIKALPQINTKAIDKLNSAIVLLKKLGANYIILGCTELAMIESKLDFKGLIPINPSTILARALIKKVHPNKLKKYST